MVDSIENKKVKTRDNAIDLVKFIALFLVLNSHMGECYPRYQFLATGGAIGDALFFFASGFTLFMGRGGGRFDEWYKRRIKRIYPSLLAVALIGLFVFNREDSFADVILAKQYWFIQCIFILYPLLYLAKEYIHNHFVLLLVLTGVVMAVFPFVQKVDGFFWGGGYYRWAVYLLFLLLGAIMGKERERIKQINGLVALAAALGCAMIWYGLAYILKTSVFLFVSIMPMMGAAIFTYLIGKSKTIDKLLHSKYMGTIIVSIGALCLESYLIQKMIITSAFNNLFPWNIPLIMLVVILASLVAKILANLIGQIFDSQPLNWHNVIKFY